MPSFEKNNTTRTPFGKNQYLRSTRGLGFESFTLAQATVPTQTIDGFTEKYIQPGTVMAKITSGPDVDKIGPVSADATDGRQTAANIVGVLETFLPWQTKHRDVEVAVCYRGAVVQTRCYQYAAGGGRVSLTNATRDAMAALPRISMTFH
jgi:hypothetical protein